MARKHGVSASQVFSWRRKIEDGALVGLSFEEKVIPVSTHKQALERIKRLERLLGQKMEEVETSKEVIKISREKTDLAKTIAELRRFSMSRICQISGVA